MDLYETKYNDVLERVKELLDSAKNQGHIIVRVEDIENSFPELKESEDESIRNGLIALLKFGLEDNSAIAPGFNVTKEQALAWLEKQGEHLENYDEAEKEKSAFVGGGFIACKADFLDFKEGETYWLEYIGDDNYNVRSDNLLGKTYHITPGQLYCLFAQQHCPKENNVNEETNAPTAYGKYVDECLNEAAKHFFSEGEDTYTVADLFYAGIRCRQSWLEKQAKQNNVKLSQKEVTKISDHELEPKFHPGDWIIDNEYGEVLKVTKADTNSYEITRQDGEAFEILKKDVECNHRLWTIADAKNGDLIYVSTEEKGIQAIFHEYKNDTIFFHCYLCADFVQGGYMPIGSVELTYPLQKTHYNRFFEKMHEAGYEWDSEKKELRKVESKTLDADKVIAWIVANICDFEYYVKRFKKDFEL